MLNILSDIKALLGFLLVLDSSDKERFDDAKEVLHIHLLKSDLMVTSPLPFVVVANKSDVAGAASNAEIVDALSLNSVKRHKWAIQSTCALSGEGTFEAMYQMANMVKEYRKSKR